MYALDRLYHIDCMIGMKEIPDGYFDLAICDPPYGIGMDGQRGSVCKNPQHNRKAHERRGWDKQIPGEQYFRELERVSRNQIIFGGNYFVEHLRKGTKGWIIWDKGQHGLSMSDCEIAYSSLDVPTRIFTVNRGELAREDTFHPTQKPVKLYEQIISKYTDKGWKILDTHAGSGACLIAAYRLERNYIGFEIDDFYYQKAQERITRERQQIRMTDIIEGRTGE